MTRYLNAWEWTPERVEELTRLWNDEGFSAQQIFQMMKAPSRSAVIGKVRRLGLAHRQPPPWKFRAPGTLNRKKGPKDEKGKRTPIYNAKEEKTAYWRFGRAHDNRDREAPLKVETLMEQEAPATAVPLAELEHDHCRYPYGEASNATFCGATAVAGLPYCPHHASRCYNEPEKNLITAQNLRREMSERIRKAEAIAANGYEDTDA
jgi:GcrA cell cycle regulator